MATPETIAEAIEQNAKSNIQSTTVGGQSVTSKNIEEQIKADNYLKGQTAASKSHFGLRFTKLVPPGGGG